MIQPGTKGGFKEPPVLTLKISGGTLTLDEEGIRKISGWTVSTRIGQLGLESCLEYGLISVEEHLAWRKYKVNNSHKNNYSSYISLVSTNIHSHWANDIKKIKNPEKYPNFLPKSIIIAGKDAYKSALLNMIEKAIDKDGNIYCEVSGQKLEYKIGPMSISLDRKDNSKGHYPENILITWKVLNTYRGDDFDSLKEAWIDFQRVFPQTNQT